MLLKQVAHHGQSLLESRHYHKSKIRGPMALFEVAIGLIKSMLIES